MTLLKVKAAKPKITNKYFLNFQHQNNFFPVAVFIGALALFILAQPLGVALAAEPIPLNAQTNSRNFDYLRKANLDVGGSTGSLQYSYSFSVSPGRGGLEPDISLSYSSQSGELDSLVGYGWSLSIPFIARLNKTGVDRLYADNYFSSSLSGELVSTGTSTYVTRFENGDFLKYTFLNNSWQVTDKKGAVYTFGASAASRQDSPADPDQVYKWMLEKIQDPNGNFITYGYVKDQGQIYPETINYTGNGANPGIFSVSFTLAPRAEYSVSYKAGFKILTAKIISRIDAKVSGNLARSYLLAYQPSPSNSASLLTSITESAVNGNSQTSTMPPTTFSYTPAPTWDNNGQPNMITAGRVPQDPQTGDYITPWGIDMLDVNGDTYPDIVASYNLQHVNGENTKKHQEIYIYDPATKKWVYNPAITAPCCSYSWTYNSGAWVNPLWGAFLDANGDLKPDLIGKGPYSMLATSTEWIEAPAWTTSLRVPMGFPAGTPPKNSFGRPLVGDINGDGLPDVAYKDLNNNSAVSLNNRALGFRDGSFTLPIDSGVGVQMADINGDGLADIIAGRDSNSGQILQENIPADHSVYLNTGSGWEKDPYYQVPNLNQYSFDNQVRYVDLEGDGVANPRDYFASGNGSATRTWIGDYNGDGLQDIIMIYAPQFPQQIDVRLGQGMRPNLLSAITLPQGGSSQISYKFSAVYADAQGNLLNKMPTNVPTVEKITTNDSNGNISATTYQYRDGYFWYDPAERLDRKFSGFGSINKTGPDGTITTTYYHQSNGSLAGQGENQDSFEKIGKPYRVEIKNSAGQLYQTVINKWDQSKLAAGNTFVYLSQTLNMDFDATASHRDTAQSFVYDTGNGNILSQTQYGEVTAQSDGSFTDLGGDKFVINLTYATNGAPIPAFRTAGETVTDNGGNKVKEIRHYYDSLPLGQLSKGNETKQEAWNSSSNSFINTQTTYNSYGLPITQTDPNGKVTQSAYDSYNLYPATVTNPLSHNTKYEYDYASGKVTKLTDPSGAVFLTSYDGLGRPLRESQPDPSNPAAMVIKTSYGYTDLPNAISVTKTDFLNSSLSVSSYAYFDGLGRLIQNKKQTEGGNFTVSDTVYDNRGLKSKQSLPYFTPASSKTIPSSDSALYTIYTYDPLGRVTSSQNAVGLTATAYLNWKTTVTDPEGRAKSFYLDAYGNLVQVDEQLPSGAAVTRYSYDYNKNLINITDSLGNIRNFGYDSLGRKLFAQDLHAPTDLVFGAWTYAYDNAGNLTQTIDPNFQTVNYTYDALNRQLSEDYTGQNGIEQSFAYDNCPNGKGRLCLATSPDLSQQYEYSILGNISKETGDFGGKNFVSQFAYDYQGNLTKLINPDGSENSYNYNSSGLTEKVWQKQPGANISSVVNNINYAETGQASEVSYASGAQTSNTYEPLQLYRLTHKATASAGKNLQDIAYSYDKVGNIVLLTDNSDTSAKKTASYSYDSLDRLTSAVITNAAKGGNYTENFSYDALGNMLSQSLNGQTTSYAYQGSLNNAGTEYANPHAFTLATSTTTASSVLQIMAASADVSPLAVLPKLNTNFTVSINSTRDERGGTSLPAINSFTSLPNSINPGGSSVLSWALSGGAPTSLTISPNIGSVLGQTGITVTPTQTTNYILTASNSAGVASQQATVTVNTPQAAAPQFSPPGGSFTGPVQITLSSATPGASIYYTTDGSAPSAASSLYANPFTLSQNSTIKAVAAKSGFAESQVSSQTYTIAAPPSAPVISSFTANPTTITSGQTSVLSWTLSGGSPTTLTIDNGVGSVLGLTSKSVTPATTTTYTLTASNSSGPVTKQVTVTVTAQPPTPVNGVCGSANGQSFSSLSSTSPGLCSTGSVANFSGSGPWGWTCAGSNGGTSASCSANKLITPPPSTNLALNKPASQSSTYPSLNNVGPEKAVDGNTNGNIQRRGLDNSVAYTNYESAPWWQVDLGQSAALSSIEIWNMTDCCSNLNDYWVFISNVPFAPGDNPSTLPSKSGVWSNHQIWAPSPSTIISTPNVSGRFIRVQLNAPGYLTLAEVKVLGSTAPPPVSPPVINTFTSNPTSITSGQSSTLSWTVSGSSPTALSIDNGVGSVLNLTSKTVSPSTTTTYTLTATNSGGTVTKQVMVNVSAPPPSAPIINTFTASSTAITLGESATLSWTLSGVAPTTLTIDNSIGSVLGLTSKSVSPSTTTTYTLTATNSGGAASRQVMVTVNSLPQAQTPIFSPNSGSFNNSVTVSMTSSTTGASIFYTLDNTTPSASSTLYSSPITLATSTTITALALKSGLAPSATTSASYVITTPVKTELTYDKNGNVTSETGMRNAQYVYDYKNRLIQATVNGVTSTYLYDHTGQRVMASNTDTGKTTYYPSKSYNTEYDSSGQQTKQTRHIYAQNLLLATTETTPAGTSTPQTSQVFYHLPDHLGSTSVSTNELGVVTELTDYYPYGTSRLDEQSGSFNEQRKFIGQEYDDSTGLNYLNARYYNSINGKFLSPDPMSLAYPENALTDPQNLNLYSYARNNPIKLLDTNGKWAYEFSIVNWFASENSRNAFLNEMMSSHPTISANAEWAGNHPIQASLNFAIDVTFAAELAVASPAILTLPGEIKLLSTRSVPQLINLAKPLMQRAIPLATANIALNEAGQAATDLSSHKFSGFGAYGQAAFDGTVSGVLDSMPLTSALMSGASEGMSEWRNGEPLNFMKMYQTSSAGYSIDRLSKKMISPAGGRYDNLNSFSDAFKSMSGQQTVNKTKEALPGFIIQNVYDITNKN